MSYKIGVDGGGTKTECMLLDGAGKMVAAHVGAGCNPSVVGPVQATSILTAAITSARAEAATHFTATHGRAPDPATLISATLLCMAGHRSFWAEVANGLKDFGRVMTTDDSLPVLELATAGRAGLVLHSGTGSFVAARAPDGSVHYAGGMGWRFGDPGSGYDLGRRAVARGLLELQGWAAPSRLGPAVRAHVQLDETADAGLVTRNYYQHAEPNRHIAALAPTVLRLAAEHDPAAAEIVFTSSGELLDFAVSVAAKLFSAAALPPLNAGLSGAILTNPVVYEALVARSPFALTPIAETPIEGVRRMLLRL
ncbi:MAG: ATPase [Verrucomicrobia bacterium]|nr:ATPase [Verrucomicrobiota bacterium]